MPEGRAVITSKHRRRYRFALGPRRSQLFRLVRLRDFGWVFVLAGLFAWLNSSGTPHLLFEYTYSGTREAKTSCTYVGLHPQVTPAELGNCPLIKFLKEQQ